MCESGVTQIHYAKFIPCTIFSVEWGTKTAKWSCYEIKLQQAAFISFKRFLSVLNISSNREKHTHSLWRFNVIPLVPDLTSMGYSSSMGQLRWFPRCSSPSSCSGESDGSGGGGEWGRVRGEEPPALAWSRSTRRVMVGEVPVSSATAWSCLASVMSTPLIWSDSQTPEDQRGPICPERAYESPLRWAYVMSYGLFNYYMQHFI